MFWHYLVGVKMEGINSKTPGKKHMDFMIEWSDKEVEASRIAKGMIENYFWKTSDKEALEINNLTELKQTKYFFVSHPSSNILNSNYRCCYDCSTTNILNVIFIK